MSVTLDLNNCHLLDHREFISAIYNNVADVEGVSLSYTLTTKLFSISFLKKSAKRKRSHDCGDYNEETLVVQQMYEKLKENVPEDIKSKLSEKYNVLDKQYVHMLAKKIFEDTNFQHTGISGKNTNGYSIKHKINGQEFLIPPYASFACGDVVELCDKLKGNKYDIVIADPPWWNKYIRRLKGANAALSYSMMYNENIAEIPVPDLFAKNCLVAVWCTNAPSNISAVKDLIFPKWGVQYLTTWYWLKITRDFEPICEFSCGSKKQPYERVILGKVGEIAEVPESQLIVSVPSALHSHKPPLLDLFTPYVNVKQSQILELFARYLLPHTTSVGYEPLKWQHISLYETVT